MAFLLAVPYGDFKVFSDEIKEEITVSFDHNGGNGRLLEDMTIEKGSAFTMPENPFTKLGYRFAGWNTRKDGLGENYEENQEIKDLVPYITAKNLTVLKPVTGKGTSGQGTVIYEEDGKLYMIAAFMKEVNAEYAYEEGGQYELVKYDITDLNNVQVLQHVSAPEVYLPLGHANGMGYNPNNKHIYIATVRKLAEDDTQNLLVELDSDLEKITADNIILHKLGRHSVVKWYDGELYTNINAPFKLKKSQWFNVGVYDENMKVVRNIPVDYKMTVGQNIMVDDNYLYHLGYKSLTKKKYVNKMLAYDRQKGGLVKEYSFNIDGEIEDANYVNGTYYGNYYKGKDKIYLFEMDFTHAIFYANWQLDENQKFHLQFVDTMEFGNIAYSDDYLMDEMIILPADTFEKQGYKLVGWNERFDGSGKTYKVGSEYKITGNMTLYPVYKERIKTATFNPGKNSVSIRYNAATAEPLCNVLPVKKGYQLTGWSEKEKNGVVQFTPVWEANNLQASGTASTVKLSWNKVAKAKGYQIYRATSIDGNYKKIATTSRTYYNNKKLKENTTYYYKIRPYFKSGSKTTYGDFTSPVPYSYLKKAPTVSLTVNEGIRVSYSKVKGAEGYEIYRALDGKNFTKIAETKLTSYQDKEVITNTEVTYKVRAYRKAEPSYVVVKESKPAAIANTLATPALKLKSNSKAGTITLTWGQIKNASGYEVFMATNKKGPYTSITTTELEKYVFYVPKAKKKYYFKVRATGEYEDIILQSAFSAYKYGRTSRPAKTGG